MFRPLSFISVGMRPVLLSKADVVLTSTQVSYGATSGLMHRSNCVLFNQLVGEREQLIWHGEAERLCGLEIDNQFNRGGPLNRQVGRLLALENAARVDAEQTELIRTTASVAHQAAGSGEPASWVDRWHRVAERQCGELFPAADEQSIGADHKPACSQLDHSCKDRFKVVFRAGTQDMELEPEDAGPRLEVSRRGINKSTGRVDEERNDCRRGDQLVQQFQPLSL